MKLSDPLAFPVKASDLTVTDTSAGKIIPILKVDSPPDSSVISFATCTDYLAHPFEEIPDKTQEREAKFSLFLNGCAK
jgi:hypothetical protein